MRFLTLLLFFALVAPLAHAQKSDDQSDDGIAGTWAYVVRPDDPVAQGTFALEWNGEILDGAIQTDAERKFDTVELNGDQLTVTFTQPNMGLITISGTFDGDAFEGEAVPEGQGPLPFVATRQASEEMGPDETTEDMAMESDTEAAEDVEAVVGTWAYKVTPPGDSATQGICGWRSTRHRPVPVSPTQSRQLPLHRTRQLQTDGSDLSGR